MKNDGCNWSQFGDEIQLCQSFHSVDEIIRDEMRIDEHMDQATRNYSTGTAEYFPGENVVRVTKLMSLFRGDFGGSDGL